MPDFVVSYTGIDTDHDEPELVKAAGYESAVMKYRRAHDFIDTEDEFMELEKFLVWKVEEPPKRFSFRRPGKYELTQVFD